MSDSTPATDFSRRVPINRQRLLERFLRYARVSTPADPASSTYPSSECQRELSEILHQELQQMGAVDPELDDNALVWGTVPSTLGESASGSSAVTVALVAHIDTSPEAPSDNVSPQVIQSYEGGDITLPAGNVITVASCPALKDLVGATLITTDGTTLLGGDDKAGVAIIMELAETLIENPALQHGTVRLLFTCDEEIGHGTDKIDLAKLDAGVAYTLDGAAAGIIDVETFSADAATVTFSGHNIHPSIAKDRMVNATRVAADFVALLPRDHCTPETTNQRDGFIHAHGISGGVGEATVELILRSFDSGDLVGYAETIRTLARQAAAQTAGATSEVVIKRQYRNLADGLADLPEAVELPIEAFKNIGADCRTAIVRGGTDGSQLTEKGLPTPNLSSGQHNIHSVGEFACLDQMVVATEHLVELLRLWSEQRS